LSGAPRLVLASASPRRRELLATLGVVFEVRPSDVDETPRPGEPAEALAIRLALAKARAVAGEGELVLGADTVVALGDEPLGKPEDAAAARAMLARLSGRSHRVWTGVALVEHGPGRLRTAAGAAATAVEFRPLAAAEIDAYVATGEPLDRAGAYAIQGGAAGFATRLEGSWSNVVGLPLETLPGLFARLGHPLAVSRRT